MSLLFHKLCFTNAKIGKKLKNNQNCQSLVTNTCHTVTLPSSSTP